MLKASRFVWPAGAVAMTVAVVAVLAQRTGTAHADRALSAGVGWATYSTLGPPPMPDKAPPTITSSRGLHLQGTYEHGVSPEVSLRAELAAAAFLDESRSYLGLGDVGAVYRFDVVRYVPYGFVGVGVVVAVGDPIDDGGDPIVDPVIVLGGGLDVLRSRTQSWGIEGRLASFAGDTTVFTLGVRGSVRWGFF
jgi:hypothetical protein